MRYRISQDLNDFHSLCALLRGLLPNAGYLRQMQLPGRVDMGAVLAKMPRQEPAGLLRAPESVSLSTFAHLRAGSWIIPKYRGDNHQSIEVARFLLAVLVPLQKDLQWCSIT